MGRPMAAMSLRACALTRLACAALWLRPCGRVPGTFGMGRAGARFRCGRVPDMFGMGRPMAAATLRLWASVGACPTPLAAPVCFKKYREGSVVALQNEARLAVPMNQLDTSRDNYTSRHPLATYD